MQDNSVKEKKIDFKAKGYGIFLPLFDILQVTFKKKKKPIKIPKEEDSIM